MKYFYFFVFIFLVSCHSIKIEENRMDNIKIQKLVGKIREIRVKISNNSSKENVFTDQGTTFTYWDKRGKIIKQVDQYNEKYIDSTLFLYEGNLLTKSITTSNTKSPELLLEYKYDKKGNEIEYISYFNKKIDSKIVKKYDSKGNVISKEYIGSKGELKQKELFEIDYIKKWVTVRLFDAESKLKSTYSKFRFDKNGRRIQTEVIFPKKEQNICTINEYDKKGNLLKSFSCNNDKNEKVTTYKYAFDAFGNVIKQEKFINSDLISTTSIYILYW